MSRRSIKDEFTDLPISRQRKYQLRKQKAGLCVMCGEPAVQSGRCLMHLASAREHLRVARGYRKRNYASPSYRLEETLKTAAPVSAASSESPSRATVQPRLPKPDLRAAKGLPAPKWRIEDEFTDLPISRQRKYQLRKTKQNRCRFCGAPAIRSNYCAVHMVKIREIQRKSQGYVKRYKDSLSYRIVRSFAQSQKTAPPQAKGPPTTL